MTVKKVHTDNEDSLQIVKWGVGTNGFRIVLLVLVLSMHPIGRGFLTGFGFKFPDQQKLEEATVEAKASKSELAVISDTIKELKTDVNSIKANNAIINAKVDSLDQTFRGFQVDFNKYKPKAEPQ